MRSSTGAACAGLAGAGLDLCVSGAGVPEVAIDLLSRLGKTAVILQTRNAWILAKTAKASLLAGAGEG